jgi:hypothetical protein
MLDHAAAFINLESQMIEYVRIEFSPLNATLRLGFREVSEEKMGLILVVVHIWRPHPSTSQLGKGFSSDEIGDGPEPLKHTPDRTILGWVKKGASSGEERRRGPPPIDPLYRSDEVANSDEFGMVAKAVDSVVTISISHDSFGVISSSVATSLLPLDEALEAVLSQLPLISVIISVPERLMTNNWKSDVDALLDAMENAGMGPYNTRSEGLMVAAEFAEVHPVLVGKLQEIELLRQMSGSLQTGDCSFNGRVSFEMACDVIAACGIDACFCRHVGS